MKALRLFPRLRPDDKEPAMGIEVPSALSPSTTFGVKGDLDNAVLVLGDAVRQLARRLISGKVVKTLCERAMVTGSWEMIPRQPDGGYLISCGNCRGALSHYRGADSSSSD